MWKIAANTLGIAALAIIGLVALRIITASL